MILYKREPGKKSKYWEIWENDGKLYTHLGVIGCLGKTHDTLINDPANVESLIEKNVRHAIARGYHELIPEYLIVIQREVDGGGTIRDDELRHAVEDLMDECLGSTGNGYCDGGVSGEGYSNVFCCVVDLEAGLKTAFEVLKDEDVLDEFVIASRKIANEDDDYVVYWPTNLVRRLITF